jgi:cyclic-di-GMP phosphodiesterase TipF (flagellum assembly factor)
VLDRALATAQPLAAEIEEISTLVKTLADSVAAHDILLAEVHSADRAPPAAAATPGAQGGLAGSPGPAPMIAAPPVTHGAPPVPAAAVASEAARVAPAPATSLPELSLPPFLPRLTARAFTGMDRDGIIAAIKSAIEASRIDLFLQPVVTLPQRKVRYYEAMSRLKAENGDLVAAGEFLAYAEAGALVPKLDHLAVLRCVQVVRRLLLKNRDIGLFCNVAAATLTDSGFPQFLEFLDANRAIAPSLVFEFTQSALRAMGPIEHESLATLAERGFRFSIDNLTDLRIDARELTDRGFRFVKAPAALLLNRVGAASTDIHPADFSDLLGRYGIDLIAERIEQESTVVDLLDYDVRFGQGFLFSPPRPVRAEALQGIPVETGNARDAAKNAAAALGPAADAIAPKGAPTSGNLAHYARTGRGRS